MTGINMKAAQRTGEGRGVVYVKHDGTREDGTIVRVGESLVFVRFSWGTAACRPDDLEWLS